MQSETPPESQFWRSSNSSRISIFDAPNMAEPSGTSIAQAPGIMKTRTAIGILGLSALLLSSAGVAQAATITLAWDANPPGTVTGYRLYWGTVSGQYTQSIDVGNTTTAIMTPTTPNRIYYFVVRAYNSSGTSNPSGEIAAWYGATWRTPSLTRMGDFDGDGRSDAMVYRGTSGQWLVSKSAGGTLVTPWGAPALGDVPVPSDYDGDGKTDIGVYRGSTGQWFINQSRDGGRMFPWGAPALRDLPVPDDYDGDGRADLAVFRRQTGEWLILKSSTGLLRKVVWGAAGDGDMPVPGDYNGNGIADIAVYRRATGQWFVLYDNLTTVTWTWGVSSLGDIPVPADYDGDGKVDIGIFRQTTGTWVLHLSATNGSRVAGWGAPSLGDVAAPGDYDGDNKADIAVFRASTGAWYIAFAAGGSRSFSWGAPTLADTIGGVSELAVVPL